LYLTPFCSLIPNTYWIFAKLGLFSPLLLSQLWDRFHSTSPVLLVQAAADCPVSSPTQLRFICHSLAAMSPKQLLRHSSAKNPTMASHGFQSQVQNSSTQHPLNFPSLISYLTHISCPRNTEFLMLYLFSTPTVPELYLAQITPSFLPWFSTFHRSPPTPIHSLASPVCFSHSTWHIASSVQLPCCSHLFTGLSIS
jgi:hypothetical protein